MDRFESNLRNALREPEAPASLAQRVLARTAAPKKRRYVLLSYSIRGVAAAALLVAVGMAGLRYQREREARLESERAKEQVIKAFQLAAEQLRPFQNRLIEMQEVVTRTEGEN